MKRYKPIVLVILDGWGLSPSWGGNALTMNNPENIDRLWRNYPHAVLQALGAIANGEPVCDSRLGHTLIGAGRKVESTLSKINGEIRSRNFFRNETLVNAIEWAKKNNSNIHLVGLISDGGIHSHINHLNALLSMMHQYGFNRVFIDAITDGTDSGPTDALRFIEQIQNKINELKIGSFSSIGGRSFAMDRDNHWDKVIQYYKTITGDKTYKPAAFGSIGEAISASYRAGVNDEYIPPALIKQKDGQTVPIKPNDAVIFFNIREDRAREITRIFLDPNFKKFFWKPTRLEDLYFATFIDYQKDLPAKIVFPTTVYKNSLSEVLSSLDFKQFKAAESEKYAHVTYFFNGGTEEAFPSEDRKIIPSPVADSYDETPQMSARELCTAVKRAISSGKYDFILVNFANVDVIAHTGNILAVGQAVKVLDKVVQEIADTTLKADGIAMITADHGNAEQMINLKQSNMTDRKTYHTLNPVPFILVGKEFRKDLLKSAVYQESNTLSKIITAQNTLADVAPTILELMSVPKPAEMNGRSLLNQME